MIGRFVQWSVGLMWWLAVGPALAQDAATDRSQSFQAVQGPVTEDIAGGPLLLTAYAIIWLALLAYVYRLNSLQSRTQAELERIERLLADAPAVGSGED